MNLPNLISAGRIVAAPFIAALPFVDSVGVRFFAFALYLVTAISDHIDGKIARARGLITDLGKVLDPLADKLLLVACFVPMFLLQAPPADPLLALLPAVDGRAAYAFLSFGLGPVHFPWWVLVPIVGREVFMTWFRSFAQARGVVIAAQKLGKWKAGFQYTWMGASFAWFAVRLMIERNNWWGHPAADIGARVLGTIGAVTMLVALLLTLVSLADYLVRHRRVFTAAKSH
ncbi:MAG TPA: CDP-alcohol phosphatidyltransferase family protein [Gemmatimonadaceae bacterium]|nr:CDP-alcohol phosphatidyltransferase family protein [Gemmatimonadaceae bacterium]HRQ78509.1 CDP-alcohol phosphatidyltransferase family protein [Gemmatimonadaceae bacterium]